MQTKSTCTTNTLQNGNIKGLTDDIFTSTNHKKKKMNTSTEACRKVQNEV